MGLTREKHQVRSQLISLLSAHQSAKGEFLTYAYTREGTKFYIGESPFVTAHILYFLHGLGLPELTQMINKSLCYLESLDDTGMRLYKFWYHQVQGTAYPHLPIDLDDTSVVNQVLALWKRPTAPLTPILHNTNHNGHYYTWLKPSLAVLLNDISYLKIYLKQLSSYRIFLKNKHGLAMAEYNDSEIIVRMNVYIMLAIMGNKARIVDTYFPFEPDAVAAELAKSLHYQNIAMYYITLTKLQKHTAIFSEEALTRLADAMRSFLRSAEHNNDISRMIATYFSLAQIHMLSSADIKKCENLFAEVDWSSIDAFKVCVGNKKYRDYHEYGSSDFTCAMALNLLAAIDTLSKR